MPPRKKTAKTAKTAKTTTSTGRWQARRATESAVKAFEEKFLRDMGPHALTVSAPAGVVSTGSMYLDDALGIGGYPRGRIVEAWGPEHAGKTTLGMIAVAQYQRAFPDQRCGWVDMEQTFDWDWATSLGVDPQRLWLHTPTDAEDTADATKRFVESGLCSLVVLDSVGGMIARIEMEKEADEDTVGLVPKIVTRMVKQVSPMAKANGTTMLVVNQVRAVIGGYGPDEDTSGGWALKHVTSIKLQVRRGEVRKITHLGQADVPVGHDMVIRVQKNKMAPYGRVAHVWLHNRATDKYGPVGIDPVPEVFTLAKQHGLLGAKGGGYYLMPSGTEVKGEPKAVEFLRTNPEDLEVLRSAILAKNHDKIGISEAVSEDDLGIAEMVP